MKPCLLLSLLSSAFIAAAWRSNRRLSKYTNTQKQGNFVNAGKYFSSSEKQNSINPENVRHVSSRQTDSSQTPSDSGCRFPESRISSVHVQVSRCLFVLFCFLFFFTWPIISHGGWGLYNVPECIYFPTLTPAAGFMFHLGSVQELISSWASLSVSVTESWLQRPRFFVLPVDLFFFLKVFFFKWKKMCKNLTLGFWKSAISCFKPPWVSSTRGSWDEVCHSPGAIFHLF